MNIASTQEEELLRCESVLYLIVADQILKLQHQFQSLCMINFEPSNESCKLSANSSKESKD